MTDRVVSSRFDVNLGRSPITSSTTTQPASPPSDWAVAPAYAVRGSSLRIFVLVDEGAVPIECLLPEPKEGT